MMSITKGLFSGAKAIARAAGLVCLLGAVAAPVHANVISSHAPVAPMVYAGDPNGTPPDSPDNRVDPNTAASPFSGGVSLAIWIGGVVSEIDGLRRASDEGHFPTVAGTSRLSGEESAPLTDRGARSGTG